MSAYLAQIRAARPDASTWVSANAGSGKTRVLTDRVARLLLAGTEPQRILCLTYTKAAAAEMQGRLFRTLGAWAMMPEPELRAALTVLGEDGAGLAPDALDAARTLFARALETPGGLRIQTIHAFCDGLLRRFPLEAGVAPRFTVLEDRAAAALRAETLDALATAEAPGFTAFVRATGGAALDGLLWEIDRHRDAFAGPFDAAGLARALGNPRDAASLAAATLPSDAPAFLAALATALAAGSTRDAAAAEALRAALAGPPAALHEALEDLLLTGAGAKIPYAAKDIATKATAAAHPALAAGARALADALEAARAERLAGLALDRAARLAAFAREWRAAWAAAKAARGALDFDDLVDRARALRGDTATAAFVLWRLDGGLDHILVDEAQDTSPAQWSVIEAIAAEFFAGLGARNIARTLFVVGDEKQSIYSFQGADPGAFARMRADFDRMLAAMGDTLETCDLLYSFRSACPILALVDSVFAAPDDSFPGPSCHLPIDAGAPGRIDLWPFLEKTAADAEAPWDTPALAPPAEDPLAALASRIAAEIRGWLDSGRELPGMDRPIRAGDILILVQRRSTVFQPLIRALKRAGVPVAGADVLRVGAELAVRDLLAALRVTATSGDDLSLAALLRSPLGGMSEEALFDLAHPRPGTLWAALRATGHPLGAILADLRGQADYLRPFEMLQRLLIRHDGRRRLVARLGAEAEDGIDALLDQALAYETSEPPSLTGFLAWMDRAEVTVKRRSDDSIDQVRVMTVHGAKGLEAPIVFLPDTASRREGANAPRILPADPAPLLRDSAGTRPPLAEAAEAARLARLRAENRRLLYVALTRARSWLILAGAGARDPDCWYDQTAAALDRLGAEAQGDIRCLTHNWTDRTGPQPAPAPVAAPPAALHGPAPPPPAAPPLLNPSALGGAHALPGEGMDEAAARARGTALHRLLDALPRRTPADWPACAAALLPERADLSDLLAEAAAVLTAPDLAAIFAPDALVEVEITAPLGGLRLLGRIDRLVVAPDRVLAVDFKSNRVVPADPADVPEALLRQMGAYAEALGAVFPGREIAMALLWTRTARLMPLPAGLAAAALARAGFLDPAAQRP